MKNRFAQFAIAGCLVVGASLAPAVHASPVVYSNLAVNGLMAAASRPGTGSFEIETADDFVLTQTTRIDHATFIGLLPTGASFASISQVRLEIYRVFPNDSNTVRTPSVPTRVNSPSDVAFAERDSAASQLSFSVAVQNASFTALNSIAPGGIHPSPNQRTGGNGAATGEQVQFDVDLLTPFLLPADHYFFIPQVQLSGGTFYWLSASRPIVGGTPFLPDLQAWTRDAALDPDWLRIGTDIVGGQVPPTFNMAFALNGTVAGAQVPEPATVALFGLGLLAAFAARGRRTRPG